MSPFPSVFHRRVAVAAVSTLVAATLVAPTIARADARTSENWSGYSVHRSDLTFRFAAARWRQPSASCLSATDTYSSFWVGLGGYRTSSDALEQIGTELDCSADGHVTSSAWFELVPAASHTIHMTLHPGDRMAATVTVTGTRVRLALADLTRGESFTRTISDATLDLTSAEWIAEAPSDCSTTGSDCTTLTLADFGTAHFLTARATTSAGVRVLPGAGGLTTTKLTLGDTSASPATDEATVERTHITATPSAPSSATGGFTVAYAAKTTTATGPGHTPS